jgi:hypothetical protein
MIFILLTGILVLLLILCICTPNEPTHQNQEDLVANVLRTCINFEETNSNESIVTSRHYIQFVQFQPLLFLKIQKHFGYTKENIQLALSKPLVVELSSGKSNSSNSI